LCVGSSQAQAAGRLAQVQVVDKASGRVLPVHVHGGRYYVAGKPGKEYWIRVRNRLGEDLLAAVAVDGVNVVSGETASYDQGGYILTARSTFDIKGWRKSLEQVAAFYFSRIEDSYAARTGRPDNVGVIGVALFRRKATAPDFEADVLSRKEVPPPHGAERSESRAAEPGLGTGHGRSVTSVVRYAEFERASEAPEEIIAFYYDSYENLVARGVIPAARRIPQPFPGPFVPDPPQG
jgi:hypothetical protein